MGLDLLAVVGLSTKTKPTAMDDSDPLLHSVYGTAVGLKRAKSRFPRYREIESVLQGKSDQDAWHIFQADQFGIDYFLTVDREILEKARQRKGPFGNLGTTIVSPAQLGEALKLSPLVGEARNQWNWAITESFLNDPYRASDRDRRE